MARNKIYLISSKEKIYIEKNSWIFEIDSKKIKNWENFYYIFQKEFDILDYNKKFGCDIHTFSDFIRDDEIFFELRRKRKKNIKIYFYNFEEILTIEKEERAKIYDSLIVIFLMEWYRSSAVVNVDPRLKIEIKIFFMSQNISKNKILELILPDEKEKIAIEKNEDSILYEINSLYFLNNKISLDLIENMLLQNDNYNKVYLSFDDWCS